jgi:hypothetical protein
MRMLFPPFGIVPFSFTRKSYTAPASPVKLQNTNGIIDKEQFAIRRESSYNRNKMGKL